MPNHIFQSIIVSDINSGDDDCEIVEMHSLAKSLFEDGHVSELSPIGHNFVQSFCVFPTGSGTGRAQQHLHQLAVENFCATLKKTNIDFVAVMWSDYADPTITNSHNAS